MRTNISPTLLTSRCSDTHSRNSHIKQQFQKQSLSLAAPSSHLCITPCSSFQYNNNNHHYSFGFSSFSSSSSSIFKSIFSSLTNVNNTNDNYQHQQNNDFNVNLNIKNSKNYSFSFLHELLPWASVFRKHAASADHTLEQQQQQQLQGDVLTKLLTAIVKGKEDKLSVMDVYRKMKQNRQHFTDEHYELLLRYCLESMDVEAALFFVQDARSSGNMPLSTTAYAHLIDLYGAVRMGKKAMQVFKGMENKDGVQPDNIACEALLRSTAQTAPEQTMSMFKMLSEQYSMAANIHVVDALLLAAYNTDDAAFARRLLADLLENTKRIEEEMGQQGQQERQEHFIKPTLFTIEVLLWIAEKTKDARLAHQVTDLLVPPSLETPEDQIDYNLNPDKLNHSGKHRNVQSSEYTQQYRGQWHGYQAHPDLVCLAVYVLTSLHEPRALALYHGVKPQLRLATQYNTMLRAATVFQAISLGRQMWKDMMDAKVQISVGTVSRVLWLLGLAGDEDAAITLFESAFQEHTSDYARNLLLYSVMHVFVELKSTNAVDILIRYQEYADNNILRHAIRACFEAENIDAVREIYKEALSLHKADRRLALIVAEAEAKLGKSKQVLKILKEMRYFPQKENDLSKRVDGLLAVIKKHCPKILLSAFKNLSYCFDINSPAAYTMLIKRCREHRDWDLGEQLLETVEEGKVQPLDIHLATSCMRMVKEDYQSKRVINMYWMFRNGGVVPNEQMGIMAVQACRVATLLRPGLEICQDLVDEFTRTGPKDLISDCRFMFNSILLFFTLNGDYKQAFHIFKVMQQPPNNLKPDFYTFDALLAVASSANNKDLIHKILSQMKQYNIRPNKRSFSTIKQFESKAIKLGLLGKK